MIIVDRILQQRERDGNPIKVGMIGAGFIGRGLANTIINATPGMQLVAVADRNTATRSGLTKNSASPNWLKPTTRAG